MLGKIWHFLGQPFSDQTVKILTFYIVLAGSLSSIIGWFLRKCSKNHPFIMRFSNIGPFDIGVPLIAKKRDIENIPNLAHDPLWIRVKMKTVRNFEQINIRLVQRKWFGWKNSLDSVTVRKITDPLVEEEYFRYFRNESRSFWDENDSRGGRNGHYKPPLSCPKDGYIWYEIKLNVAPHVGEWKGYIGFQHLTGDDRRAYAHLRIRIRNIQKLIRD